MEKKKAGRKSKRPPKEQFETLYKEMSAKEVGEHFGVSPATVYQWSMYFRNKGGGKFINKKSLKA